MVNEMRGKRYKPRKLGVVRKSLRNIPKELKSFPTITNVPLHPETGRPIMKKLEVQERKKVRKGVHAHYIVLLMSDREQIIQREILH